MYRLFSRAKTKSIFSISIIFLFITSMILIAPVKADLNSNLPQGNNVSWQNEQNSIQENWNWSNQGWQFGPYPSFNIILQNGTEIDNNNYLPLSQPFTVEINILKSVFTDNTTLGQAGLHWNTNLQTQNGTSTGTADVNMMYVNSMQFPSPDGTNKGVETNTWHINSNINNQTNFISIQQPMPGPQQQIGFYQFEPQLSNLTESSVAWTIFIVGYFNSSTPIGPFNVNLQVQDQNNNSLDVNSQAGQTTQSNYRQISVGAPGFIFGNSQGSWTFAKLDMQNNPVLTVSKGAKWKMAFNITTSQLTNVTVGLNLPWNMQESVNVTGWYNQVVTEQGGWMFNDSSGTYYWNASATITRNEQVFGPHLEHRGASIQHNSHQVNITNQQWDPVTNTKTFVTMQQYFQDQLFLIYNQLTQNFDMKIGYCYSSYDPVLQRDVQYQILNPINASDPSNQFYILSIPDCRAHQTTPNQYTVEFVGIFSNSTDFVQDQYTLNPNVYSVNGQVWNNWLNSDPSNFQIAVDRPVAVSTILDSHGNPATQSMFLANQGQAFTVESKIYGGTKVYQNIDSVGVSFQSNYGSWTNNQSSNSQIEIRLVKNLDTGEITSKSFNRTNVNMYVYGSHLGWAYVNVIDWHTEYNSETGTWDWVNSPHLIWNQTTLTDWHWAYYQLNQTEYAINPNSRNIWIDTSTCWIDGMDPAFLVPSSYAEMPSANVSVTDGVVKVDLRVVFNQAAPQGNYWYNMIFQNYTYGQDPSLGWGQHSITEWTSQPIYYINGTVTNGQPWLVQTPSNPLYTQYNGTKYQVDQLPYISINGNNYLIKPQSQYDQAQQKEWSQYLLNDPYDPSLGRQPQYYQLMNGTKIYVDQAYQTIIRTLHLTCNDSYTITNSIKTVLPAGTTITTYMPTSTQDWNEQFWDPMTGNFVPYHYTQIDGTRIYRNGPFEQSNYNATTSHWELGNLAYTESDQTIMAQPIGQGVLLNSTVVLLKQPGYWQSLPDGSGYYLVMQNGTRITISNPWSVGDNQRAVSLNGDNYLIGWPSQYYSATYQGIILLIPDNNNYVSSFFYTNLGVDGGLKYELPYSGAMATSWWDLQGIESTNQKLPTIKTINVNNQVYILDFDSQSQTYSTTIGSQRYPVTYPTVDYSSFYSNINGQDYWDVVQNGWLIKYGSYSTQSGTVSAAGTMLTTTGYDQQQQIWSANRFGYDMENSTYYLTLENGTRIEVSSGMYLTIWKVQVGNQSYYTTNSNCQLETSTDPITQQQFYRNYFNTLDNQKIYFNSNNPANWGQEIHISIPGTNYTKLVPYSWQPQTFFDKLIIYNITVPEKSGSPTHTGVYFANGTEVPVGTQFFAIGSSYGPATYNSFSQIGNDYQFNGAYVLNTQAPWNSSLQGVSYCLTLNGQRIYSFDQFGWNGNNWGIPEWQLNGDPASANCSVPVTQGGYAIYLNDSIFVPVTSQGPLGGGTNNFLVMTNGTRLDIVNQQSEWFTVIGTQIYYFRNIVSYSNFNYRGASYSLGDPLNNDQRHMLTPSIYNVPAISQDKQTWLMMNSISESILHDNTGYYLINASDFTRVNLQLVDSWWNLSDSIRNQIFSINNQPSNYYPRYSITINGIQYYVIDPSPSIDSMNGQSVQQIISRYPDIVNLNLDGQSYQVVIKQNGYWNYNVSLQEIETINLNGQSYDLQPQYSWTPSYQVPINSQEVTIQMNTQNIYMTHQAWGNIFVWRLTDLGIPTSSQINNLIVGTPNEGMWGIQAYKINQDTGAIALKGDLSNASNQYFVRKIHSGSDIRNQTINRMSVTITWKPNGSKIGDQVQVNSWMGQLHESWTSQWDEEYIWYHASDMSQVTSTEMNQIRNTVVNNASGKANPGYWDIAYMVKNQSWSDILGQAKANNWDWINTNTNSWNWLWFGTDQNYNVDVNSGNTTNTVGVDLKYEFAGLSLFNGTYQTHYFMPTSVGNVSFVTPGQAYGNMNSSGGMTLPLDATINFGVTYNNVNGTLFPYSADRSMWGWWNQPIYGADFNSPDFNKKPTDSSLDQLAFMVHFGANQTSSKSQYNSASMKIDQRVGKWNLNPNVIDGRQQNDSGIMVPLTGNDVLTNRSLDVNYYVTASTSLGWNVKGDNGTNINNNNVQQSSTFDLASQLAGLTFASIKLGSTYDWGKPVTETDQIRTFNVTSQTTSIQNFQSSFQSDAGKSSTGFDISQSMYFLTQGFPNWDGYPIYNDPQVSLLVSKGTTSSIQPQPSTQPTQSPQPSQKPNSSPAPGNSNTQSSSTNTPTSDNNNPKPQSTQSPNPTQNPQQSNQPQPTQKPITQTQIPTTLIAIGIGIAIAASAGSVVLVKRKKN